jgi:hypothetical protein
MNRPLGWAPCPHYLHNSKVPAPDICPWCKVEKLQKDLLAWEEIDPWKKLSEYKYEIKRLETENTQLRWRAWGKPEVPLPMPWRRRMKARLQNAFSGLKARWKKVGTFK